MENFNLSKVVLRLAEPLKRKRKTLGLSLSEVSGLIGVGASTLSRIERLIGKPDAETIAILAAWLEIPLDRIYWEDFRSVVPLNKPLPVIVSEHLQKDENLTPEGKEFLSEFFSQTYQQFVALDKRRKSGGKNAPARL